jgi:hypothetical protein
LVGTYCLKFGAILKSWPKIKVCLLSNSCWVISSETNFFLVVSIFSINLVTLIFLVKPIKPIAPIDSITLINQVKLIKSIGLIDALPTPRRTQMWVPVENNGRRRSRGMLPGSQHFEG